MADQKMSSEQANGPSMATVATKVPVTLERSVREDLDDSLPKTCIHMHY